MTVMKANKLTALVFQQYEDRLRRLGRAKNTIYSFQRAIFHLEAWVADNEFSVDDLEPELLEEFFAGLNRAPSTKRLYLVEIRAAFMYALRRGMIERDPTLDVQLARIPDRVPRVLSSEQLRSLLRACQNEPEHTMVALAVYTGLRRFEIAGLVWDNIDLRRSTIQVVGKGGKYRIVPIHPVLGETLNAMPFKQGKVVVGPRGGNSVGLLVGWLRDISNRAGVKPVNEQGEEVSLGFHDFRRTLASSLDANGVQEGLIHRILGWASQSIFDKHYRNVADRRLQEAILRAYADDPVA